MLKKIVFCAILALQFAAISSVAASFPDPNCPPSGCPTSR